MDDKLFEVKLTSEREGCRTFLLSAPNLFIAKIIIKNKWPSYLEWISMKVSRNDKYSYTIEILSLLPQEPLLVSVSFLKHWL